MRLDADGQVRPLVTNNGRHRFDRGASGAT